MIIHRDVFKHIVDHVYPNSSDSRDMEYYYRKFSNSKKMFNPDRLGGNEYDLVGMVKLVADCLRGVDYISKIEDYVGIRRVVFDLLVHKVYGGSVVNYIGLGGFWDEYNNSLEIFRTNPRGEFIYRLMCCVDDRFNEWKYQQLRKALEI